VRGEQEAQLTPDRPGTVRAPDLPPGPRVALIVATSRYDDPALRELRSPVRDAADFAGVMGDPQIGGFTITEVIDKPEGVIRRAIADFLSGRDVQDTVLVYLSCHGIQDARGRLFFAAADTVSRLPVATAVRAAEVWEQMEECRARRQILILDCCFSGAFNDRSKGDTDLERQLAPQGRGRSVLTASRGFEYSFEGEPLDGAEAAGSVFTAGLVEGLRTGAADADGDGLIRLSDAYDYAYSHVQRAGAKQTPQHWLFGGEGAAIVLARSPAGRTVLPAPLPEALAVALGNPYPALRIAAINELALWLADPDPARVLAASRALRHVTQTDMTSVARVAQGHLHEHAKQVDRVHPAAAPALTEDITRRSGPAESDHARFVNYYELLDIDVAATDEQIKAAIKQQRVIWYPRQKSATREVEREAQDRMAHIRAAERTLLYSERRAAHDRAIQSVHAETSRPAVPAHPVPRAGRIIGIDLGTTQSAVAIIGPDGIPEILPNRESERITPSVVYIRGDELLVGTMAKRAATTAPDNVVQCVKRQMGDPDWHFTTPDGAAWSAEQVSAIILRRLKQDAESALGEEIDQAVITVPAFFDDARRKATMDAGQIAGLNVRRIINEPTAAALAFGITTDQDCTLLVYDLGGGTFDVTVMRISQGRFDVLATDGNRNLGGYDWDSTFMVYINEQVQEQGGPDLLDDNQQAADLRDKAETAKHHLTTMTTAEVLISAGGKTYNIPVTRVQFEQLTHRLLSETCDVTESVLEEASLTWAQIDKVLLVGGSTRMPMVQDAITTISGKVPVSGVSPDEAVALGAAIQAHLMTASPAGKAHLPGLAGSNPAINDVTSHGLGTLALNPEQNELRNYVLIKRNASIPAKGEEHFATITENQPEVEVVITQGDETDPEEVTRVGESTFKMPRYPKGSPIRIDISYDLNGTIHAQVFDGVTGKKLGDMRIDRNANLTQEEIDTATAAIRKLDVK
jgi:molecular chaperone DnaK